MERKGGDADVTPMFPIFCLHDYLLDKSNRLCEYSLAMKLSLTSSWVWQQERLAAIASECPSLWMPATFASAPVEVLLFYPSQTGYAL
jgi:hypothetical protein